MARTEGRLDESSGKVKSKKIGRHRAVKNSTRVQRAKRALWG
jgi:hypothetical protein